MANRPTLSIDMETFSHADLKLVGQHVYFAHPSAKVLMMAWAFGQDEPQLWWSPYVAVLIGERPQPFPPEVLEHVATGGIVRAWNAAFEWNAWPVLAKAVPGLPPLRLEQVRDTMAEGMAMGLPRSLFNAGRTLGIVNEKMGAGMRLIKLCSCPLPPGKPGPGKQDWIDYGSYCMQDVRAEREIAGRILRLSPVERRTWELTVRTNHRGVKVDMPLARAMSTVIDAAAPVVDQRIRKLTHGAVSTATERARLADWLCSRRVWVDDLQKRTIEWVLATQELPVDVREVLTLRRDWAKSSPRKLSKLIKGAQNGVLHDQLMYHGAHTGRWSSVGVQLQNMLRPPTGFDPAKAAHAFLSAAATATLPELGEVPLMEAAGSLIRHSLVARDGYSLMVGDYAQVEARGVAYLAEESVLLEAFANKRPIYEEMAARIFGRPIGKDDPERQIGKITVLGCGYQLGRIGLLRQLPDGSTPELAASCVAAYREEFPAIVGFWRRLEDAVVQTVRTGKGCTVGRLTFRMRQTGAGPFLVMTLPSGRHVYYYKPTVLPVLMPWDEVKDTVVFMGTRHGGKLTVLKLYGGLIAENATQAMCRDLLRDGMLELSEVPGWHIWLTVHDENVVETPDRLVDLDAFRTIMERGSPWAPGFPLEAKVKTMRRYGKG